MSTTNGCGSSGLPVSNFTTVNEGTDAGTAQGDMPINSQASINGSVDLSAIVVAPSGAFVQSITYEHFDGIARHGRIYVYGQGPKGMGSGSLTVTVTTANGTHDLSLTSSSPACHTDSFEDTADIQSISWAWT
jgi:hypothetical protein